MIYTVTPNFSFLSQLISLPILDSTNTKKIGMIDDFVVELKEMYPRVVAIILRRKKGARVRLPWSCVKSINEGRSINIGDYAEFINQSYSIAANELRLKEIFWDKQIVDTHGSKVVRVNDLHLLREKMSLWVIHVDIGIKGLLRRLGWLGFFGSIIKWLFDYEIKDKFISWKYVHPLADSDKLKNLSLKVPVSKLNELHPADLADILIDLGVEEKINVILSLDNETAAGTFQELPLKIKMQIADLLELEDLAKILNEMPMDEVVDFLAEIKLETRNALFKIMPLESVLQIKDLLQHSNRTAGSLMNTEFVAVNEGINVADILSVIKYEAEEFETIYYIYVVDKDEKIAGIVTLKQLLTAEPDKKVGELMRTKVVTVEVHTHVDIVAKIFFKYDFVVVPVVNENDKLVGIITMKDAFEAVFPEIREETEEIS
ncbi:MAG: CBS domain-containing protein [Spirochaetota bacterium]